MNLVFHISWCVCEIVAIPLFCIVDLDPEGGHCPW